MTVVVTEVAVVAAWVFGVAATAFSRSYLNDSEQARRMAVEDIESAETTLEESYAVGVPPKLRERLDLEPSDRLRWGITDDGRLVADIVRERYGVAEDFDPIDIGEETNAVVETEELAYEVD